MGLNGEATTSALTLLERPDDVSPMPEKSLTRPQIMAGLALRHLLATRPSALLPHDRDYDEDFEDSHNPGIVDLQFLKGFMSNPGDHEPTQIASILTGFYGRGYNILTRNWEYFACTNIRNALHAQLADSRAKAPQAVQKALALLEPTQSAVDLLKEGYAVFAGTGSSLRVLTSGMEHDVKAMGQIYPAYADSLSVVHAVGRAMR